MLKTNFTCRTNYPIISGIAKRLIFGNVMKTTELVVIIRLAILIKFPIRFHLISHILMESLSLFKSRKI